jgi:Flp pilus assembly protein TadG
VELALVMLVLVVLMTATADAGRAFYTYNSLVKAARSGVRYLALANPPDATAQTQALNLVLYGDVDTTSTPLVPNLTAPMIQICTPALCPTNHKDVPIGGTSSTMSLVSVRITGYTYQSVFSAVLPATIGFGDIQATMRGLP